MHIRCSINVNFSPLPPSSSLYPPSLLLFQLVLHSRPCSEMGNKVVNKTDRVPAFISSENI